MCNFSKGVRKKLVRYMCKLSHAIITEDCNLWDNNILMSLWSTNFSWKLYSEVIFYFGFVHVQYFSYRKKHTWIELRILMRWRYNVTIKGKNMILCVNSALMSSWLDFLSLLPSWKKCIRLDNYLHVWLSVLSTRLSSELVGIICHVQV